MGTSIVEIFVEKTTSKSVSCENTAVETAGKNVAYGVGLRLLQGTNSSYGYTNDLSKESLLKLAEDLSKAFNGEQIINDVTFKTKKLKNLCPVIKPLGDTTDEEIIKYGIDYLKYSVISYFFFGLSLTSTIVLRNIGQVRMPLYTSIGAFFVNVGANYIFIFGKLGIPKMGVAGAAIGTLISRIGNGEFRFLIRFTFTAHSSCFTAHFKKRS